MSEQTLSNPIEEAQKSKARVLLVIRSIFVIMLVTMVMLSLLRGGGKTSDAASSGQDSFFIQYWWIPLIIALLLGASAISLDALTPRKKLSGISSIIFGLLIGLLVTVAFSWVIGLLLEAHEINFKPGDPGARILLAIQAAFAITLCYLGVSVVYTTQDEFRLVIPYVEFSKLIRGARPLVLDTSAIIDGRFNDIALTGFIAAPVIIPRFVIDELQALSDSADRLKRSRGRRGLDIVRKMQNNPHLDLGITDENPLGAGVDQKLLIYSQQHQAYLVTTDFNLNKVASIHEVKVLNVNDLANALKPAAIPGEDLQIEIIKRGEGEGQGIGYLDDGTMVVVENAASYLGEVIVCTVTSSIQTSAGRMIFCESMTSPNQGRTPTQGSGLQVEQIHSAEKKNDHGSGAERKALAPGSAGGVDPNAAGLAGDEAAITSNDADNQKLNQVEVALAGGDESGQVADEAEGISGSDASATFQEKALRGQSRVESMQPHPQPRKSRSRRNPRRSS